MGSKRGQNGVGFLIKAKYKDKIKEIQGTNDRTAVLKIEVRKTGNLYLYKFRSIYGRGEGSR